MARKQFTFYDSFYNSIQTLPTNKQKLQAYETLCAYALQQRQPDMEAISAGVATVFHIARPVLDAAYRRSRQSKEDPGLTQAAKAR